MKVMRLMFLLPLAAGCVQRNAFPGELYRAAGGTTIGDGGGRHTIFPLAAHHQHLVGPTMLAAWHRVPMGSPALPPVLDSLLAAHRAMVNARGPVAADAYKDLYAPGARLMNAESVIQGAPAISQWWARVPAPAGLVNYVLPLGFDLREDDGYVAGILIQVRPDSSTRYARRLMHVLINTRKGTDGKWRIVMETATPLSNPVNVDTLTARSLIAHMDEVGVRHGVIAALGYHFTKGVETPGEAALVQAENDWTVRQAAQYPGRLVVFCGVNPVRDYSLAEMERCSKLPQVRGMKLYFHDRVDMNNAEHIEKVRRFFSAANGRRMALLVHLSVDGADGSAHARKFLEQIVPAAPDIPIQIAHLGSGASYRLGAPDAALKVFADAAAAGNPLMKNLYLDVTGSVYGAQPRATYDTLAQRMRTIGLSRIVFGSDLPFLPQEKISGAWSRFREFMPLTDDELRVIAGNVAPYAR